MQNTVIYLIYYISSINKDRIYSAARLCESLGGQNEYTQQCQLIPEEIDPVQHGIHLVPGYKKFTLSLSKKKSILGRRSE